MLSVIVLLARIADSRTVKSVLDVITDIAIVFSILGLVIFLLAFAGCVGVLRQNIPLLRWVRRCMTA